MEACFFINMRQNRIFRITFLCFYRGKCFYKREQKQRWFDDTYVKNDYVNVINSINMTSNKDSEQTENTSKTEIQKASQLK